MLITYFLELHARLPALGSVKGYFERGGGEIVTAYLIQHPAAAEFIRRNILEKYLEDEDDLKHCIITRVDELIDCIKNLGRADLFQITVRYINGEIITITDFPKPDSIG